MLLAVVFFAWSAANNGNRTSNALPVLTNTHSQSPQVQGMPELASLETYNDQLNRLQNRFAELDEFQKRTVGQSIVWRGLIDNVRDMRDSMLVIIAPTNQNWNETVEVSFPTSFRTRLLALRRGDVVRFAGVVHSFDLTLQIDATNFWLDNP